MFLSIYYYVYFLYKKVLILEIYLLAHLVVCLLKDKISLQVSLINEFFGSIIDIKILNTRSKYNQNRPLLIKTNNQKIKEIYEERKTIYKLAHHKIICDKLDKKEIVKKIIKLYELQ